MKKRSFVSMLLVIIIVLSSFVFASCNDDKETADNNDGKWQLSDEPGRPSTPDGIPDGFDLGGYRATAFFRNTDTTNFYECEGSIATGENANPVFQGVYERNVTVEWRLNCKIDWIPSNNGGLQETKAQVNNILNKQEYYDFINTTNNTATTLGLNALLCDLNDTEYIDLSQPWWWDDVNSALSVDRYTYNYISGDMHLVNFLKMSAFYFNTELVETMLNKDKKFFYDLVDNKEWTIEYFYAITKNLYKDTTVNADMSNKRDQGDIFAFPWVDSSDTINQFTLSTRVADNMFERDENGRVTMHFSGNEDILDLVEIMRKLLHESEGAWKRDNGTFGGAIIKEFSEGNYVFLPHRLTAATTDYLRDMDVDYGILPYPTLEAGDDYISDIQDSSTSLSVQAIVDLEGNLETVSAIVEALCSEAYRYTTVAFYELALKSKYARDDDASRMIDIIYESAHKCFIVEYSSYANGIVNATLLNSIKNNTDITSSIASTESSAQSSINEFISKIVKGE